MRRLKTLHITPWFPHTDNLKQALWIKRHVEALEPYFTQEVWHVCTVENSRFKVKYGLESGVFRFLIYLPTDRWFIIEFTTFFQLVLLSILKRKTLKSADILNFHIAYPLLTYLRYLRIIKKKVKVITEHWSAYHFKFGVGRPLPRIQNIFKQGIPLITVSNALKSDIEKFSGVENQGIVIPNVVDTKIFRPNIAVESNPERFFMVSQWKYPKDPIFVISKFAEFAKERGSSQLYIGGFGPLENEIKSYLVEHNLSNVHYLGSLEASEISKQINLASALIHISEYETFSVVCAEAICCGCPVIASKVGGIPEFINDRNGVLIDKKEDLTSAMIKHSVTSYDRSRISSQAKELFSTESVGKIYSSYLRKLCVEI